MDIKEYQIQAKATDQFSEEPEKVLHPLLNLTESVGVLHRFIEQSHRDKSLPDEYAKKRLTRKIGDILWYIANIASRSGIDLTDAAKDNLARTSERWGKANTLRGQHFDDTLPVYERLPRKFRVAFFEPIPRQPERKIMVAVPSDHDEWIQVGDRIDDNTAGEDGYRFHDVLHLANAAHLGWSPVIRALLRRKRKSIPEADRIQDGARAVNLEEALTAFVFAHAKQINFFNGVKNVEFGLLKTIERLTLGLEVRHRSYEEWELSILEGYRIFRELREQQEGLVVVDLSAEPLARLKLEPLPSSVKAQLSGSLGSD
jgi:NTP pyrophosphatase (non-canonical NTP hydrolase)